MTHYIENLKIALEVVPQVGIVFFLGVYCGMRFVRFLKEKCSTKQD